MNGAAFFDLDKTVIARSSGLALGKNLYREGLITRRLLLRSLAAQVVYLLVGADENKMEGMREKALQLTKGWQKSQIESIVQDVMGEVIEPIIYKEALELIEKHKSEGRKVYIVSSSPEEIVGPLGELLEANGVIASRAKVDEEGRYTGELEFYCYGLSKPRAMSELAEKENIDLAASFAYSDSITDLPMLEAVGHPVAANPDRELKKAANERGWEIVKFESPITIRKRLAEITPDARTTVMSGGAAISIAAALGGYLWLRRKSAAKNAHQLTLPLPGKGRHIKVWVPGKR